MAKKKAAQPEMASPSPNYEDGSDKDYNAESAYRDLTRAHEHRADAGMMERVKKFAGRKHKAVTGLHSELGLDKDGDGKPDKPKDGFKEISQLREYANKKSLKKIKGLS